MAVSTPNLRHALHPASGGISGIPNGYAPENGVYSLLDLMHREVGVSARVYPTLKLSGNVRSGDWLHQKPRAAVAAEPNTRLLTDHLPLRRFGRRRPAHSVRDLVEAVVRLAGFRFQPDFHIALHLHEV